MDANQTVLELRRLELEIMEHERAVAELTRQRREMLEVVASRPDRRQTLSREGRQRMLQQACQRS